MRNDVAMYQAVAEARRLHAAGLSIQAAAADAAEKFGLHPLHVGQEAARAIESCRRARDNASPEPMA